MCETTRRMEHLIALCKPRSVNSKSETRELSPYMSELKSHVVLCHESQNPVFSPLTKGKIQSFEKLL